MDVEQRQELLERLKAARRITGDGRAILGLGGENPDRDLAPKSKAFTPEQRRKLNEILDKRIDREYFGYEPDPLA